MAVALAKRWALAHQIMDVPNARSSHTQPMPRAGGIGMVVTFCVDFLVAAFITTALQKKVGPGAWAVVGGGIAVAIVGLIDDFRHLPARARFGVHLLAAIVAVAAGARIESITLPFAGNTSLEIFGAALSVLWIVAVTNIYNFMDGIDGIAAGVAVISSLGLAILGLLGGDSLLVMLACALAGSALGFLAHNFPPASVFMGDVGSGFLGFLLAGLALLAGSTSS